MESAIATSPTASTITSVNFQIAMVSMLVKPPEIAIPDP